MILTNENNVLQIILLTCSPSSERMLTPNPEVEISLRFDVSEHKFTCKDFDTAATLKFVYRHSRPKTFSSYTYS